MQALKVLGTLTYAMGNTYLIGCVKGLSHDDFVMRVIPHIPTELTRDTDCIVSLGLAKGSAVGFDITPIYDLRYTPKNNGIQLEAVRYTDTDGAKPVKVFDSGEFLSEDEFADYSKHYVADVINTLWREYSEATS